MLNDMERAEAIKICRTWLASADPESVYACTNYDLADECQNETGVNVSLDDLEDIFDEIRPRA